MVYFTQFSVVVPFLYRYFALCRNCVLSGCTHATLLGLTAVAAGLHIPFYVVAGVSRTNNNTVKPNVDFR